MSDYEAERRLFHAMKLAGWSHDGATGGFTRVVKNGAMRRKLWVSWGQAGDALRLADDGEKVAAVEPQSERVARIVAKAGNAA